MTNKADNPRAVAGDNGAPLDLFEEAKNIVDDLYEEAGHWLDGGEVETEKELEGISMLLETLGKAGKTAEANRKEEKKPHDDAGKAVQAKYLPLIKRVEDAQSLCKKAMQPYMLKQEEIRLENERKAREEAEQAEREAQQAAEDIRSLEDAERAAEAIENQKQAEKTAKKISNQKTQAKGGAKAVGLKTVWDVELTSFKDGCNALWPTHKQAFIDLAIQLAKQEVRGGNREINGFKIESRKTV